MSCPWGTAADTCPAGKLPHASCRDSQLDSLKTRSAEHPHKAPVLCELNLLQALDAGGQTFPFSRQAGL